jgi:virginiamycin B lyase
MSRHLRSRFHPSVETKEPRRLLSVTVNEFPIPSHSGAVVAGLDSAIWIPQDDGQLGRMSTTGELTSFGVGAQSTDGLAVTSNGDIWFTTTDYQIGRLRPGGETILFDIPHNASSSAPSRLAAGPDGNLWFTEQSGNQIGRLTPERSVTEFMIPTERSLPAGICAGPDGNVWFTESNSNAIGRITPSGKVTEFSIPTPGSLPLGIAKGPDGNIWFGEKNKAQLGRLNVAYTDLAVAINAQPSPATVGKGMTYTITVTNHSSDEATNVVITDPLPFAMSFVASVTSSQGTSQAIQRLEGDALTTTVIAQLGTLKPGSIATVTIVSSPLNTGQRSATPVHSDNQNQALTTKAAF